MTSDPKMGWRMVAREYGGPEVIAREDFAVPEPGEGEVVFETEAVGLNFIDVYYRTGLYKTPIPTTLGSESAGTIIATGKGVTGFAPGDRVGCINGAGAYATHRLCSASQLIPLPDAIPAEVAAATMLKGFTAAYLAEDIVPLATGDWALVHSAAGGVGSILVPWLRDKGVRVIAHVGSEAKVAQVDAEHVLYCPFDELADRVRDLTNGAGVDISLDGVGQDSWKASVRSVRRRGMLVSYGNASGAVPPISLLELMRAGSIAITRPTLADFMTSPQEIALLADRLFSRIANGVIEVKCPQRYALTDAAKAHRALEARQTTGSTVMLP